MRVLVSAIACHPAWGSEAKFGWDAVNAISKMEGVERCHVITHESGRDAILQEQKSGKAGNIHFHFFGYSSRCHPNRMLARLQSWYFFRQWQNRLLPFAQALDRKHSFDITHHVTYATWRVPSPLWRLPAPFVWGPLGGGSSTPASFYPALSRMSRYFEKFRRLSGFISTLSPAFRSCVVNSTAVLAADSQTADFLRSYRSVADVRILSPAFFPQDEMDYFSNSSQGDRDWEEPLALFGGGNLEGRKGVAMSLCAIALLKAKGLRVHYTLGGSGPERSHLERLSADLGISECVRFSEGFTGDEYREQLANSDVYLLPSIRETAGITMMESVLARCYPIVLAGTGAGDIVEQTGGSSIQADSPAEAIRQIANQLEWCHENRGEMRLRAAIAGRNMRTLYSENAYQSSLARIYAAAIEKYRVTGRHS